MAVTDRVRHAKRYAEVARLLVKHHAPEESVGDEIPADAESLARDLESMGPTFIKLGQLLSTRNDLLPVAYCTALSRLQDDVEPLTIECVTEVFEEELGMPPTDVFEAFDSEPLASASLGQVHRARLHSGRSAARSASASSSPSSPTRCTASSTIAARRATSSASARSSRSSSSSSCRSR